MPNETPVFVTPAPVYRSRRAFLRRTGSGMGLLALAGLMDHEGLLSSPAEAAGAAPNPMLPRLPHFEGKAKSVIWLFLNGGPSQVDTWDYKPELEKHHGKELPGFDKNTGFFTEQV